MRHKTEISNIARGKAECYISIEAERQVLYFSYSTRQGNALTIIKNFLYKFTLIMKHPTFATSSENHVCYHPFLQFSIGRI